MRYTATFKDKGKGAERTLPIQADDRNEAVRIAKAICREGEVITKITFDASSIFEDIMNNTFLTPLGNMMK